MKYIAALLLAVTIAGCTPAVEQDRYATFTGAVSSPKCSVVAACGDAYENLPTTRAGPSTSVAY